MNIPEFYDSWRERTELQHEIERLRAERKVEHELETDILYFVCAPLVVAAVVLAPAICRAMDFKKEFLMEVHGQNSRFDACDGALLHHP